MTAYGGAWGRTMTPGNQQSMRSWDTAVPTVIVCALAMFLVRPSAPIPGISDLERELLGMVMPCLLAALILGLVTVVLSLMGRHRYSGLSGVTSLLLVSMASLFSGLYGVGGVGAGATLAVTLPLAVVMALRESKWRKQGVPS